MVVVWSAHPNGCLAPRTGRLGGWEGARLGGLTVVRQNTGHGRNSRTGEREWAVGRVVVRGELGAWASRWYKLGGEESGWVACQVCVD